MGVCEREIVKASVWVWVGAFLVVGVLHALCVLTWNLQFFIHALLFNYFYFLSHQDGQVGPEQVGDEDGWHDDGVADDDSFSQELVVAGTKEEGIAVITDTGQKQTDQDANLK